MSEAWRPQHRPREVVRPDLQLVTLLPAPGAASLGAFVSIARFSMSGRVFPPHPHAGFAAMTYMLQASPGAMMNRDSLGFTDRIRPGGAHWTIANAGMMHEETPYDDERAVEGFQIFIDQPAREKAAVPTRAHAEPEQLPSWRDGDLELRLIMGEYAGRSFDPGLANRVAMIEVKSASGTTLDLVRPPLGLAAVYVEQGEVRYADGTSATSGDWIPWPPANERLVATTSGPFAAYMLASNEVDPVSVAGGPFIMADEKGLATAFSRYRAGEMGRLELRE